MLAEYRGRPVCCKKLILRTEHHLKAIRLHDICVTVFNPSNIKCYYGHWKATIMIYQQ